MGCASACKHPASSSDVFFASMEAERHMLRLRHGHSPGHSKQCIICKQCDTAVI